jgi:hypothetical protein
MQSAFEQAIKEHLALRQRNASLEQDMPLSRYRVEETVANHALFKPEAEARLEETQALPSADGWPVRDEDTSFEIPQDLWARSPSFDWGD